MIFRFSKEVLRRPSLSRLHSISHIWFFFFCVFCWMPFGHVFMALNGSTFEVQVDGESFGRTEKENLIKNLSTGFSFKRNMNGRWQSNVGWHPRFGNGSRTKDAHIVEVYLDPCIHTLSHTQSLLQWFSRGKKGEGKTDGKPHANIVAACCY